MPEILHYERKYRDDVLSLLFYCRRLHSHLDWYKAGAWLDGSGHFVLLYYESDVLRGVLGVSDVLNGATWLRLAAVDANFEPVIVLSTLWDYLRYELMAAGVTSTSVLLITNWIESYLPALGFHYLEDVVTMYRSSLDLPKLTFTGLHIQNAYMEHLPDLVAIDHRAFTPPWQMSLSDLRHAQRQAANCLIADYEGQPVAYHISTRHHTAGHLARLAVIPDVQGKGVGSALLYHLLDKLQRRGVRSMTVNTQESNIRSQYLYRRFNFARNGLDLGVWQTVF